MFPKDLAQVCIFYAVTPLHAGSGQATGAVDLPIQRERHTLWPHVQASGVKGAMRDWFYRYWEAVGAASADKGSQVEKLTRTAFGSEEKSGESGQTGAVSVTDARLLAFPVRSNVAPFVWVTSPAVLNRLRRDMSISPALHRAYPECAGIALQNADGCLPIVGLDSSREIILEDLVTTCEAGAGDVSKFRVLFKCLAPQVTRLLLISDQNFSFLVQSATEVQPQIRINMETGTAEDGSLRYEELLPADSVLYSVVFFAKERTKEEGLAAEAIRDLVMDAVSTHLQMGGGSTLGRGIMELTWLPGKGKES